MEIQTKSPSSIDLSKPSETLEESVTALNQVLDQNPGNAVARQALYETMQQLLRKDAFLAYQSETNAFYTIRTPAEFQFIHPKDRIVPEPFPAREFVPAKAATTWLGWSVVGLIPAGLGALVCAPLAILASVKLLHQPTSLIDRRRAWVILSLAIVLWLFALAFLFILTLHLV